MPSKITFSIRPFTFGEIELLDKAANQDITAGIDLIVARSDPKVTRDYVCSLTEVEAIEAIQELFSSIHTVKFLDTLVDTTGGAS